MLKSDNLHRRSRHYSNSHSTHCQGENGTKNRGMFFYLTELLQAFSIALSGEAGVRLLADVGVPTSANTRLRSVKRSQLRGEVP